MLNPRFTLLFLGVIASLALASLSHAAHSPTSSGMKQQHRRTQGLLQPTKREGVFEMPFEVVTNVEGKANANATSESGSGLNLARRGGGTGVLQQNQRVVTTTVAGKAVQLEVSPCECNDSSACDEANVAPV